MLKLTPGTLHRWLEQLRTNGPWGLLAGKSPGPTVISRLAITEREIRDIAKLVKQNGYAGAYRIYSRRTSTRPELARYLASFAKQKRFPSAHLHQAVKAAAEARKARRSHDQ